MSAIVVGLCLVMESQTAAGQEDAHSPRGALGGASPEPGSTISTTEDTSVLNRHVRDFEVRDATMGHAVTQLRRQGVRVCFERVWHDPAVDHYRDSTGQWVWREVRFSVSVAEASVGQVLDELVKCDPRYAYCPDQGTGLLRIYPKSGSMLDWKVGPVDVEKTPLCDLLFGPADRLGLLKHGVRPGAPRGFVSEESRKLPVTVHIGEVSIAECLSAICSMTRLPGPSGPCICPYTSHACYDLIPAHEKPYAQLYITWATERDEQAPETANREFTHPSASNPASLGHGKN
jgi:hypothetical protein